MSVSSAQLFLRIYLISNTSHGLLYNEDKVYKTPYILVKCYKFSVVILPSSLTPGIILLNLSFKSLNIELKSFNCKLNDLTNILLIVRSLRTKNPVSGFLKWIF